MREMGTWREYQIKRLANDREAAIDYLQLTLEEYRADGDLSFFLKELRVFIASQGGVSELSERTGIDIETLLDALSNEDPSLFDIFNTILNAFGGQLPIQHKVDAKFSIKTSSVNPFKDTLLSRLINCIHPAHRTQRAAYRPTSNCVGTFSD